MVASTARVAQPRHRDAVADRDLERDLLDGAAHRAMTTDVAVAIPPGPAELGPEVMSVPARPVIDALIRSAVTA